ncbi:Asp-tRNA(Asn)/Glu-tRNA(Gln) amidotransferase subunit GatA [Patescibacteria group bacterium]|jgi:aspartyl-tRNA(Asn)/glutamyl-tRNA(Gln) amidotransferase subunit A|nr:Asp-tRNA(Asn)/Glu-tRNA(Gln) amidotransferase subunit GatA [Patescibacteria group bacterium]
MKDPLNKTIVQAAAGLHAGDFTSVDLTKAYLQQIRGLDISLHAYLDVLENAAIDLAHESDERRAAGKSKGPLDGVPIAIKDNILIAGHRATAGSRILETYQATYDATVISKLREAGAVFIGKTNMDEFAMGSSTERSAYGPTKNPHDVECVPGGSSGGSAAAVAGDMCVAALGSDTGGSIRQPAAFCGIVGFKPSYGRVSRYGLMAMASSLDQIGPMTKTVEDAAILFKAIMGTDPHDQTTADGGPVSTALPTKLDGLKIGVPSQAWRGEGMTPGVRAQTENGLAVLKALGATLVEIDLPYADEALAVYYVLMPCEVSANLARFDGMRYGRRETAATLIETYEKSRGMNLGEEVRRRVMLGAYALSKGYYDAYYRQARKVQTLIRRGYRDAFSKVDLIVTPTAPSVAFRFGEKMSDPLAMYLEDVFTVGANVAGIPAISVPCGMDDGMPVGFQILGPSMGDAAVLDAAHAFEKAMT